MKLNRLTIAGVALSILMMAGMGISQDAGTPPPGPPPHHRGFDGGPFGFFGKQLGLTPDQRAQLKQIFSADKPTLQPLMQQEKQFHEQMMQLITGTFDETKAQAIATQESQVQIQLEVEHAKLMSQAYQILTPDQKTKFAQMQQHMAERMQHHGTPPPANQ